MYLFPAWLALLVALPALVFAQKTDDGFVKGVVVDHATHQPVQYVTVILKPVGRTSDPLKAMTDAKGLFTLEDIPLGDYALAYGPIGTDLRDISAFTLDAAHRSHNVGILEVADRPLAMAKLEVSSRREAFYNSIDRKVYNVGSELQSANGNASELMQNIPSVQVDVDGNVSLRGSENVLILIDGRPSTLMGANRAAVLEQLPADTIERIEVITNPSAKYKPDGTAGIINIVLKKKHAPGYSGSVRASAGNSSRSSTTLSGNYNPGKYNLYGSYSLRQDDRVRSSTDNRTHLDPESNTLVGTRQATIEHARPRSHILQAGADYKASDATSLGAVVRYNYRSFTRHTKETDQELDKTGLLTSEFERTRIDPEYERDAELKLTYQHSFAKEGEELQIELQGSDHAEQENNRYTDTHQLPVSPPTFDNTRITQKERNNELVAEYVFPFENDGKLETGYSREANKLDADFFGSFYDPALNGFVVNPVSTNRFLYSDTLHSLYGTCGRTFGKFGFLAGLRFEQSIVDTNQLTSHLVDHQSHFRAYPTLHFSYHLTETSQLQLNYSRRVHRPESDDLNPYPEYQDPYNLRAGNPKLVPEDIHSIEAGYQYRQESTTYLGTVYYRQLYHGFTQVTRYIDASTLLTTRENLAKNRSGGLELVATRDLGSKLSMNFSSNIYYNQIDAANLGFTERKSTITWDGKLSANYHWSKTTLLQLNSNFTARRLTPQGYRYPTYIANFGLKHDFKDKKTSLVLTVSDIFNSFKERTRIETPTLRDDTTRRRTSRIVYVGLIYNLGKGSKKTKDDSLQYDTSSP